MICHLFLVQELSCDPLQVAYIELVQMGPINPDYAELHFIGVCRSHSRLNGWQPGCPLGHQVSSSQTGSLLPLVHLLHTTTNIPSFSDASFFAAWMGRVMRHPP